MAPTANHTWQPGKTNFSLINQPQLTTKSGVTTNQKINISLIPTQMIAVIWWLPWTTCIYWDIMMLIIFIIILEMIRKQRKKFDQMKHFEEPTCITLFNVGNTISTVTSMNETTALQLSTVVDNGLIEGY